MIILILFGLTTATIDSYHPTMAACKKAGEDAKRHVVVSYGPPISFQCVKLRHN